MTASTATFTLVEAPARTTWSIEFVAACLGRLGWSNLALSLVIGFPIGFFQQFARNFHLQAWQLAALKLHPELAGAFVPDALAIAGQCFAALIGAVAADEAISRGVNPLRAYVSGVLVGGTIGALLAVGVGAIFHIRVGFKVIGVMPGGVLGDTQPLVLASVGTVNIAFVTLVLRRWQTMRSAQRRRHTAELARAETRRRAFESSLQAMQARVEPDFLFSTLDLVLRRFETQPEHASVMLDDLVGYLHAVLPHLRESTSTVANEVALAQAFFNIMRSRGESADALSTTMTDEAAAASLPPMILLPLLNAFSSGSTGDRPVANPIVLNAGVARGALHLTIEGASHALRPDRCNRLITETTDRLRALYGGGTQLSLEHHWTDDSRSNTRIRLELPYETSDRGHR